MVAPLARRSGPRSGTTHGRSSESGRTSARCWSSRSDWEAQLAMMSRSARHELRRKLRRADRSGPSASGTSRSSGHGRAFHRPAPGALGETGLFADTADGERSRTFLHRLAELEAAAGPAAQLQLVEVAWATASSPQRWRSMTGRPATSTTPGWSPPRATCRPGVVGYGDAHSGPSRGWYPRFDFLRGDEPYKYEWGAVDEAIDRVVVRRRT